MPTQSNQAQISDSYPIADLFGRTRVVQNFYFTRGGNSPFFWPGNSASGDAAYDLITTDGNYAAAAGTYDAGAGWQPLFQNTNCSTADSWILAPKNLSVPFSQGQTVATLAGSFPQCPTVDGFAQSLTVWNYYQGYGYQSGKSLNTIKSWHFGGPTVNSNAIEVFFFTKEYGKTRWEAWQASSERSQPDASALSRCGVGTNNGVATFGQTTYYLADCHDWSFIFPAAGGSWNPGDFHIDPFFNSINLLSNTHMQCTNFNGRARTCGVSNNWCQTIAPWKRSGDLNWTFNQNPQAPRESSNCSLIFSVPSQPNGAQSVYQDAPVNQAYTEFTFGAALKAPAASGVTYPLYMAVFEISASGGQLAQHVVNVNAQKDYRIFKGSFTRHPDAKTFRFQIYPDAINTQFELTDAWIAPKP
ncbi:hypothetical protein [uncultured Brevundimonas sp.]|uniref:hypothetical protein n=1 Tax=uncultured Brevundimonas sp. TaxID=213418 RepID=UPI0025D1130E|nr:hypothetical protein [uncultured Brevundimonas sp.]